MADNAYGSRRQPPAECTVEPMRTNGGAGCGWPPSRGGDSGIAGVGVGGSFGPAGEEKETKASPSWTGDCTEVDDRLLCAVAGGIETVVGARESGAGAAVVAVGRVVPGGGGTTDLPSEVRGTAAFEAALALGAEGTAVVGEAL